MKPRPSFPARLAPLESTGPAGARRSAATSGAHAHPGRPSGAGGASLPARMATSSVQERDYAAVRRDMVRRLMRSGIADATVLSAMGTIERHRFVDSALHAQAYQETSLPIGLGQTISKPGVVARMIELLRQGASGRLGRVLEIGTGCGYQAAVLSLVASEVYSVERLRGLHERARENLRTLRLPNVHLLFGDGMVGYAKGAPYAGIIAAAGGGDVPAAWTEQLAVGGRLVAPVAGLKGAGQAIVVIERTRQGLEQTLHEAVHFVPLKSGVA
ncbi:MAG: protein-L-isoaspartate(D-aspartate) O-methyltransferase [Rhodoferax sp.]|nr:protein-L-isoaspartate(D-aspartate) O-methyltransferase [Rhodoferax sp.]